MNASNTLHMAHCIDFNGFYQAQGARRFTCVCPAEHPLAYHYYWSLPHEHSCIIANRLRENSEKMLQCICTAAQTQEVKQQGPGPGPGGKITGDKPRIWQGVVLMFPKALRQVAIATERGVRGPGRYWGSYKDVPDGYREYSNAMMRHVFDEVEGDAADQEGNIEHATAVAWNALARLEHLLMGLERGN